MEGYGCGYNGRSNDKDHATIALAKQRANTFSTGDVNVI